MLGIGAGITWHGLPAGFRKTISLSRFRMADHSEQCRTRTLFQRRPPRPREACAPALVGSGRKKVPGDQGVGHRPHRPDFRWSVCPESSSFWTPVGQPDRTLAGPLPARTACSNSDSAPRAGSATLAGQQLGRKKCLPALLWLRARTKRAPMKRACRSAILRPGSYGPARSASGWMTPSCAGTLASPRMLAIAKRCRPPPPRRGSPSRAMWK